MYRNPLQKRILTVEDLSCFGKCSSTVALPILSAMGHEVVVLPTAILSTHTGGFTGYTVRDLTDDILPISRHWKSCGIPFDAIYTGYLCKGRQVSEVRELIAAHRSASTLLLCDPAMADNGKYYYGFDAEHGADMAELCKNADVLTPNVTEAAFLLGEDAPALGYDEDEMRRLIDRLTAKGARSVVLTSVSIGERYGIMGYDGVRGEHFHYFHERVGAPIHGTGDTYTSVLLGKLLAGASLADASRCAADFVRRCVELTYPHIEEHPYGLIFEPLLRELLN